MRPYKTSLSEINKERTWYFILCTLFLFVLINIPSSYANEVVSIQQLAKDPYWHSLLHYKKTRKGFRSLADGSNFFIHPQGYIQPELELQANMSAFFIDQPIEDDKKDPRCRFPLRYQWLRKKYNKKTYPKHDELPCTSYQHWKSQLGNQKIYINFASNYTNNPASMFGHTFLRIERTRKSETLPDLLHYTINFAAETSGDDGGIVYTVKGLFGGYPGVFSTIPFYQNIQKYNHIESRDLWEYPLKLSSQQIDIVIKHLWELGNTFFRYYFVDENCSYFLLLLLEMAEDDLNLRADLPFFTIPLDTLRTLQKKTNWLGKPQYRSAIEKQYFHRYKQLNTKEKRATRHLLKSSFGKHYNALTQKEKARSLDTAIDYFAWVEHHHAKTPFQKKLLLQRSKLPIKDDAKPLPQPEDPLGGHKTTRLGLGYNHVDTAQQASVHFRLAYHDLLDNPVGFDPVSQVEFLNFRARFNLESPDFKVHELEVLQILSLYPFQRQAKKISWNVSTGYQRVSTDSCIECGRVYLQAGPGLTFAHIGSRRIFLSNLINLKPSFSTKSTLGWELSPQLLSLFQMDITKDFRFQARSVYEYSIWGASKHRYSLSPQLAIDLGKTIQVRGVYTWNRLFHQWGVRLYHYF